jgi:hypothetical protein
MDLSLILNLATLIGLSLSGYKHFDKKLDELGDRLIKVEMSTTMIEHDLKNEIDKSSMENSNRLQSVVYRLQGLESRIKKLEGNKEG